VQRTEKELEVLEKSWGYFSKGNMERQKVLRNTR
jgi:hypothetical protein